MTHMDYTYPAAKAAAPWGAGRYPGMPLPVGAPAYGFMGGVSSPYAAPMAGKYGSPGGFPAPAAGTKYPAPWPAASYASPWGSKAAPGPIESPAPAPYGMPPMYMSEMLPAASAYEPAEEQMIVDLSAVIIPALNSVLPAIHGLMQIPHLLMELNESNHLLSRWDEMVIALTPAPVEPPQAQLLSQVSEAPEAEEAVDTAGGTPSPEAQA